MEDLKEDLTCPNCGATNNVTVTEKGGQFVARCNVCDTFIKNIPQGKPCMFYFGKYKGQAFADITDEGYLHWAYENCKFTTKCKLELGERIIKLGGRL